ncbi:2195_t:CDS:1, partial [Dentiscutata erythropus]
VNLMIEKFQKEQKFVEFQIRKILNGKQLPKPKKSIVEQENKIMNVFNNQSICTTINFLKEIA